MNRIVFAIMFFFVTTNLSFAATARLITTITPAPPNLVADISFSEPSGNNILDAEETGVLVVKIQNKGDGDAFDVVVEIEGQNLPEGLSLTKKLLLGFIPSGGALVKEIKLVGGDELVNGNPKLNVFVKEAGGFDAEPLSLSFQTRSFVAPKLILADLGMEDTNGNGKIDPQEVVELTARIQNIGHGDSRGVKVDVELGQNVYPGAESPSHFDLGALPAGSFKDVKFSIYTNKRIKNGEKIPVTLKIAEARPRLSSIEALNLVMNAPNKKTEEIVVAGKIAPQTEISIAGGLSVDVDMKIPNGQQAGNYDIAVIIGNRAYTSRGVPVVEYANRDAQIMREYLVKTFGFAQDNIIFAEDATFTTFNEIFGNERDYRGRLYKYLKPNVSSVFIYYVGHGAPDLETGEAYFVPVDANPQYLASSGYRLQTFYANLSKLPAKKVTVVLDTCFSGNSDKGLLFQNISPALVKVKKGLAGPKNGTVITSAAIDQVSSWYPEKRHSLFTYFFLKGVGGAADSNNDSLISVAELKAYLNEHVPYMARRLSGTEQQPTVAGADNEVFVRLTKEFR